nr:uncharacterized protein LOC122321810 [Drosophila bipectinata]
MAGQMGAEVAIQEAHTDAGPMKGKEPLPLRMVAGQEGESSSMAAIRFLNGLSVTSSAALGSQVWISLSPGGHRSSAADFYLLFCYLFYFLKYMSAPVGGQGGCGFSGRAFDEVTTRTDSHYQSGYSFLFA